jgi:hypothetical protein
MSRLFGGALLLILSAIPAVAQDPDPLSKLDATSRFAVDAILDSARVLGLPVAPINSRALEGINKHADNRRILAAVRAKFSALKGARSALSRVSNEDLSAGASLLEAGLKREQLAAFSNPPRSRSLLWPFVALGDLMTRGVPHDDAFTAIARMWQGGAGDEDFKGLYKGVESDILQGLNPGTALQNRMREQHPVRSPPNSKLVPPAEQPETPSS